MRLKMLKMILALTFIIFCCMCFPPLVIFLVPYAAGLGTMAFIYRKKKAPLDMPAPEEFYNFGVDPAAPGEDRSVSFVTWPTKEGMKTVEIHECPYCEETHDIRLACPARDYIEGKKKRILADFHAKYPGIILHSGNEPPIERPKPLPMKDVFTPLCDYQSFCKFMGENCLAEKGRGEDCLFPKINRNHILDKLFSRAMKKAFIIKAGAEISPGNVLGSDLQVISIKKLRKAINLMTERNKN